MACRIVVGVNDLETVNPKLSKEWDYFKNDTLTPNMFTAMSHKKVWWKCENGHEWIAEIKQRSNGLGCPQCRSEKIKKFGEERPELLKEWDYEKNEKIDPYKVAYGSHKKVWWKCENGHEWIAEIRQRSNGSGCPQCRSEKIKKFGKERPDLLKEWDYEKNEKIDPYKVAYGSHKKVWWKCKKGHSWQASINHRTSKVRNCPYCAKNPIVLRGENDLETCFPQIANEWNYERNGGLKPSDVTSKSSKVVWWRCDLGHEWRTSIQHRTGGSNCPKCASSMQTSFPEQAIFYYVNKYYSDAINGYRDIFNKNGMELDIYIPSLNIGIEYDGVAFHKTKEHYERECYKYTVCKENDIKLIRIRENANNTSKNSCDYLLFAVGDLNDTIEELVEYLPDIKDINIQRDTLKIKRNYSDRLKLESFGCKYPEIAAEWNNDKNEELKPDMFKPRSNTSVWWKCKLGHEWKATIDARVRGTGCPYCSNNRILKGYNDLSTKRPDLLHEWDFEKNKDKLDPTKLSCGSGKKAWWKCTKGHSWNAEISSRNKGAGCPYCAGNRV